MSLSTLLTLVTFGVPVATFTSVLLLWCSYWVNGRDHATLRKILMWLALSVAILAQMVIPVMSLIYSQTLTILTTTHPMVFILALSCNAICFIALVWFTMLNMRDRYKDIPSLDYYSPLPSPLDRMVATMTGRKTPTDSLQAALQGETNAFNAQAAGYASVLVDEDADPWYAFCLGASWAAGTVELFPDEVQYLKDNHDNIDTIRHALAVVGMIRTSAPVVTWDITDPFEQAPKKVDTHLKES